MCGWNRGSARLSLQMKMEQVHVQLARKRFANETKKFRLAVHRVYSTFYAIEPWSGFLLSTQITGASLEWQADRGGHCWAHIKVAL